MQGSFAKLENHSSEILMASHRYTRLFLRNTGSQKHGVAMDERNNIGCTFTSVIQKHKFGEIMYDDKSYSLVQHYCNDIYIPFDLIRNESIRNTLSKEGCGGTVKAQHSVVTSKNDDLIYSNIDNIQELVSVNRYRDEANEIINTYGGIEKVNEFVEYDNLKLSTIYNIRNMIKELMFSKGDERYLIFIKYKTQRDTLELLAENDKSLRGLLEEIDLLEKPHF